MTYYELERKLKTLGVDLLNNQRAAVEIDRYKEAAVDTECKDLRGKVEKLDELDRDNMARLESNAQQRDAAQAEVGAREENQIRLHVKISGLERDLRELKSKVAVGAMIAPGLIVVQLEAFQELTQELKDVTADLAEATSTIEGLREAQKCASCGGTICPPMQCGLCIEAENPVPGMPARPATTNLREKVKDLEGQVRELTTGLGKALYPGLVTRAPTGEMLFNRARIAQDGEQAKEILEKHRKPNTSKGGKG